MTQNVKGSPGRGKLTKDDIKDIREQYRFGTMNQYQLATKYKVDQSTISGIVNNRYYKDINYNEDLALNNRLKAIEAENGRLKKGLESLKKHTKYIEEQVKDLQEWR
jgi:cell division protein FtsB